MANILFMDGFDFYNEQLNMYSGGLWSEGSGLSNPSGISTTVLPYGRGKSYVCNNDNYDWAYLYDWGSDVTTFVVNVMLYFNANGWWNDNILMVASSNGYANISLVGNGANGHETSLSLVRGVNSDKEEVFGTYNIKDNRWYHMEFKVYLHATAGTVEWRVNGESVIDLTSKNTIRTEGASNACGILLGKMNLVYVDNLVVHDGTVDTPRTDADGFLGPIEIITLFPDGDATPNNWTRSTGTNGWEIVDNQSPSLYGDTEAYLMTNTATDAEKFNLTALPTHEGTAGAWQIKAVQAGARVGLETPGAQTIEMSVGTNVETGIDVGAGANKWVFTPIYEYSTGTTDWTESDINSLTVQVELE